MKASKSGERPFLPDGLLYLFFYLGPILEACCSFRGGEAAFCFINRQLKWIN